MYIKIGCSIPVLESKDGICVYPYNHAGARYACRQKLNNKKSLTMTATTPRPTLTIAACRGYDSSYNCTCTTGSTCPNSVSTSRIYHIESSKGIKAF